MGFSFFMGHCFATREEGAICIPCLRHGAGSVQLNAPARFGRLARAPMGENPWFVEGMKGAGRGSTTGGFRWGSEG
jgi:hypothetical protein